MADDDSTAALLRCCTRCGESKPATLDFFSAHKPGKYGLHSRCRPCKKLDDAERRARPDQKARQQAWRDANKDYAKAYNAAYRAAGYKSTADVARWREKNIEHARRMEREKQRRLYRANPEKYRQASRKWAAENPDKRRAYNLLRYRSDKWLNLKTKFANRLRKLIVGKWPQRKTSALLGYARDELIRHIERQFTKGMTWELVLAGKIEIDHIVPVRAFDIREPGDAEFRACWALANLRPLWKLDNRSKSGKVLTLL